MSSSEDDVTACGLLKQTTSHKFINTLSILKEVLTHSAVLSKTFQHRELSFATLLSAVSYCIAELDDILRRKDDILVTLDDDLAKNAKFGFAGVKNTEASTNSLSVLIQLL